MAGYYFRQRRNSQMMALKIDDIKQFTAKLFVGETFDQFLVREANIVTFNTFSIDGHIRQGYYTDKELEENQIEDLSAWSVMKPICFSLIKGKKLPGSFQVVLQIPPKDVERFLLYSQLPIALNQVNGLYINIRYEEDHLSCITGTSLSFFTLDKSIDLEWDEAVKLFLKEQEIGFEVE